MTAVDPSFDQFVRANEPRLRAALVLLYGPDDGREATAEALAWAWENWEQAESLTSPVAFLYRVGQSRTRRIRRRAGPAFPERVTASHPWVEPALSEALNRLSPSQRVCTVLVCSLQWTLTEVAEMLDISKASVQTHVERGMTKLRAELQVDVDE